MPALTLWTHPESSNGLKVRFLLEELELPFTEEVVSMARPRPDAYMALNPVGGLPLLRDGDFLLAESQTILRYLAGRTARDDLYPADLQERARVDEFLDRFNSGLRTQLFRREAVMLGWSLARGFAPADADPSKAAAIEAEIQPALALLDELVSAAGAALGRFTIADCAIAPVLQRAQDTGLDLSAYARLQGLSDTLLARPAWCRATQEA